ncbi:MAG TPA: HAMP domain-containing sensor histidine kinase [Flavobacterium sp.]|nr:HAMP domain-containing sensor histidine kinase [Flavobacterium sp.]
MKFNRLNSIIVLGLIAIIGILIAQLLWTRQAYNLEEVKFSQKVHVALLEVVKKLYEGTSHELPADNPVQKVSNDYYIVNVANDFEPEILEYYLKTEFEKSNLGTDFEYAMYNCQSDEMVYGNYVSYLNAAEKESSVYFPKHQNLVYYFAIRFPNESSYMFSSLRFWFILSFALVIILVVYVYSIFTILQQKKYSELQRDFINNMTHEFKTPLSSILIASNYLVKQEKIRDDDKLEKYANIIISQGNKLNSHVEKILNIAKSDSAPMTADKVPIELVPQLREAIENIKLQHPNVIINIEAGENYVIEADEFHLTNLIYNLLDNSIKYCDKEPIITIRLFTENKKLHLQFIDNGIGIDKKDLPFIFDRFYRSANSKSNEVNGFGLGLHFVERICKLHSWKISATNNAFGGITTTIQIPLK